MTACLVSPFSWYHHWVWILPMLAYVYNRWGAIVLALFMVPFASVNVLHAPQLLFTLVPVGFMLWYTLLSGYAHPSIRRGNRGCHSSDARPVRRR